jgi:hypothetical protein
MIDNSEAVWNYTVNTLAIITQCPVSIYVGSFFRIGKHLELQWHEFKHMSQV